MSTPLVPIFDGHNDVLLRLLRASGAGPERDFLEGESRGHWDLPRARKGGLAGGFFAVYVSSREEGGLDVDAMMSQAAYDVPLPLPIPLAPALEVTLAMASLLFRLERASAGAFKVCRTAGDIKRCLADGTMAAIFHIEGAEAIDPELAALDVLHAAGLRSIGPVWSRPNIFGHGVPFRYPSTPDTGPGLTESGRALVRACNRLRIMIDLSHLNEAGFWEVAELSDAPLVATHSNAHAICPHSRNLTDRQLDAIAESDGMVGVNFATAFIRPDGRRDEDTPLDLLADHVDHLVSRLGIDRVGLGSDFDGATIPAAIGDVAGLPNLVSTLRRRGYDETSLRKICHQNWIRVLETTWGT
jgi:membrane dipeptidase